MAKITEDMFFNENYYFFNILYVHIYAYNIHTRVCVLKNNNKNNLFNILILILKNFMCIYSECGT